MYALREEGNITAAPLLLPLANFYPRPPRGGRQGYREKGHGKAQISIHALREEGDRACLLLVVRLVHFYPRPP